MYIQLLCHLIGDFILQSSWMANEKLHRFFPAFVHASVYSLPFLFLLHPSAAALCVILGTHAIIDHFRLAKFVAYGNHFLSPPSAWKPWSECSATGYHKDIPPFISFWLMVIVDNTMHLVINALALAYL